MSENREIEAKTILAQDSYQSLVAAFPKKADFIQTNYYFDSSDWELKANSIGLRIRLFSDHAEQTLKVPDPKPIQNDYHEVIEINDSLDLDDAVSLISEAKKGKSIDFLGKVGNYLNTHFPKLMPQLSIITWSKTRRILAAGPKNCELTLDQTSYPDGFHDYELEIENTQPELIQQVQTQLEKEFAFRQTDDNRNQNKSARALQHRQ